MIRRLDELRDADGVLTHKLCPVCFNMTHVDNLFVDADGQKWDLCSEECAVDAGYPWKKGDQ